MGKYGFISRERSKQEAFAPLYFRLLDEEFKDLSALAILLYTLLRNRVSLSIKNKWIDEKSNNAYVLFTNEEACKLLHLKSKTSAIKVFNELENFGLITKKQQGFGKPSMIFVMDIFTDDPDGELDSAKSRGLNNEMLALQNMKGQHYKKCNPSITENERLALQNLDSSYNNSSYNSNSYNSSHSFNNKHDLKDSDGDHESNARPEIEELNERMRSRENERSLADQFGYDPIAYKLGDEQFKEIYIELYEGKTLSNSSEDVKAFIDDLIGDDELCKGDKLTYGKAIKDIIYEVFTSKSDVVRITKDEIVSRLEIVRKLLMLDLATIGEILIDLNKRDGFDAVKYPKNYLMRVLWDAHINQGSALKLKYTGASDELNPDNSRRH